MNHLKFIVSYQIEETIKIQRVKQCRLLFNRLYLELLTMFLRLWCYLVSGVDAGYLEGGFRCIAEGVRFAYFISFFLKYPME